MQKNKTASAIGLLGSIFAMLIGGGMIMAPATAVSSTSAGVSGDATTEEQCGWRLDNAPSSVSLTAAGEYELEDLDLVGTHDSVSAYATGTDYDSANFEGAADDFSDCVMYGNTLSPSVSVAVTSLAVTAEHESDDSDSSMAFDIGSGANDGSFTLGAVTSATCENWTEASSINFTSTAASDLMSLAEGNVDSNLESGEDNQICSQNLTLTLTVPGGKVPDDPGGTYTFGGFSLITELVQQG